MEIITKAKTPERALLSKNLTTTLTLNIDQIDSLFQRALWMSECSPEILSRLCRNVIVGIMFYQNSTRTRLSFESAIRHIGGTSIGFSDPSRTRAGDFFQESLLDTAKVLGEYTTCLVIRHPQAWAVDNVALVSKVPVVNGGDGANEHPTQALLDLWMMTRSLGSIEGRTIGLVGDPACRDFRSLFFLLAKVGAKRILLLAPPEAKIPLDVKDVLQKSGVELKLCEDIRELLALADAIDMLPFVLPDFSESLSPPLPGAFQIDERFRLSQKKLKEVSFRDIHIFHVGPRGPEFPPEVNDCPSVKYFEQIRAGIFLRAAIFESLLLR